MQWSLDKSLPICPQICEQLCVAIASGEFSAGSKLLSVREVALLAGVNPNTVQKSFEQLERRGVIHSRRGSGWFVSEDVSIAAESVNQLRLRKTRDYLSSMEQLGFSKNEVMQYLSEYLGGKDE